MGLWIDNDKLTRHMEHVYASDLTECAVNDITTRGKTDPFFLRPRNSSLACVPNENGKAKVASTTTPIS